MVVKVEQSHRTSRNGILLKMPCMNAIQICMYDGN